jgi:hypothetical protein
MKLDLLDVVALLTDFRSVRVVDCTAEVILGDVQSVYRLHAEPWIDSYEVVGADGRVVAAYIASLGAVTDGEETFRYDPRMIVWRALAARLAFPLELPIWGRSIDSHRMSAVDVRDDGTARVTLAPNRDRAGAGHIDIDLDRRLVTDFSIPSLRISYRDFALGRGRLFLGWDRSAPAAG